MGNKNQLDSGLEPVYGTKCILYATGSGWAYGERTTTDAGVTYASTDGSPMAEPVDWQVCEDDCAGAEVRKICGVLQIAGFGDLIAALTKSGTTVVDNGDGTATITGPDGVPVTVSTVDTTVTYTYAVVDGMFVATGSDDTEQTIALPEDTDTLLGPYQVDPVTGVVTQAVLNADGTPTGDVITGDFSGFISDPHPTINMVNDGTAVLNAATNSWDVSFVDTFATVSGMTVTDADGNSVVVPAGSSFNPATNSVTLSDGSVVVLATDTDTFATYDAVTNTLTTALGDVVPLSADTYGSIITNADGSQSFQTLDADGNAVGVPVDLGHPNEELVDCNGVAITDGVVACGPNDYTHTDLLPMGVAALIAPLNNDNLCDNPVVSLVSGSEVNVSVALNSDGTHSVTPVGDACADGSWSYGYETVCNGVTQTATVSGFVDNMPQTHAFHTSNETTVNLALVLSSGGDYSVDWGDGVVDTLTSSTSVSTHVYTTPYTGDVTITYPSCSEITQFRSTAGHWDFDIGTLPSGLTYYSNIGQNTTSGDIGTLPGGLIFYDNTGQNTTSGDIGTLPSGLTYYSNQGQNTTSGDIGTLPSGLTYYSNQGQNTTSGDIGTLPTGLTLYSNTGQNTTSGDIGTLPTGLTFYRNIGQNTTSGDIGTLPSGLTFYDNTGQNTTSGDIGTLPSGLTFYRNQGQNTTSGDIGTLPSGLTFYLNAGQNTTSGDIGTLPTGLTLYLNAGQNTTSGDIGTLPSGLTYYSNTGQNAVIANSTIWSASSSMRYFQQSGLTNTSTEVDNMLVALANNVTTWVSQKYVDVSGNNAAPSAIGIAAIATISSAGATTILTN